MYAYTASTAVSHSVCVVFSSTLPAFSLSTTRQHAHIRTLLSCGESISIAIINTSIAAWHIKSLSEIPALHVLSTKWHSLLPALIPHSVIRAHLLQSIFGRQFLNRVSLSQHFSRAFVTIHTHTHTLVRPHVSCESLRKPLHLPARRMPSESYCLLGRKAPTIH